MSIADDIRNYALDAATYPAVGNHFVVFFYGLLPTPIDMAFKSVSEIKATVKTESLGSGGSNWLDKTLPSSVTYSDVTFERGLKELPSPLRNWFEKAFESFEFVPIDVVVCLLNAQHFAIHTWYLKECIPVEYSFAAMDAETSAIQLEKMKIKPQSFKSITI